MTEMFAPVARASELMKARGPVRGVGIVGAGAVVQHAHLPAYASAGIPVRSITDLDLDRARATAAEYGIPVAADLDALLNDDSVEVVDVAVHPRAQPEICHRAFAAGKHVLAQKPLAEDTATARELVAAARSAGLSLVVNHQMRYGEGMASARAMAELGWIGEVTAVTFDVDIATDWTAWPWLLASPRLDLLFHSIHYTDSIRALLGTPTTVFCATGRRPGQAATGETRSMTTMLFDSAARAQVNVNHENITGDHRAHFRIDGSEGSIRGTIGLLYDYPHGRPDTVEVNSTRLPTDGWVAYPVTGRWIPDAFAGPMLALMRECSDGTVAPTTGSDAVLTLAVVEAAYRSAATGTAAEVLTT